MIKNEKIEKIQTIKKIKKYFNKKLINKKINNILKKYKNIITKSDLNYI